MSGLLRASVEVAHEEVLPNETGVPEVRLPIRLLILVDAFKDDCLRASVDVLAEVLSDLALHGRNHSVWLVDCDRDVAHNSFSIIGVFVPTGRI